MGDRLVNRHELADLLEGAYKDTTPGLWRASFADIMAVVDNKGEDILVGGDFGDPQALPNVAFAAFAHNVMPNIIKFLREGREES